MTGKRNNPSPLTFGLDIGIASVGWAVLGENRIVDLGVRCFDKAETAKEGESLNLARRTARLLRRRLRRRAWRLTKLARLLKRESVITDTKLFQKPFHLQNKDGKCLSFWQLRVDALARKLEAEEWARVIYHLCKHRGFHWISKADEKAAENDNEGGRVKKGLAGTKKLMLEKSYRTAAEMVLKEFPDAQRNKHGDYSKALSRVLLANELKILFEQQRKFGNPHAGTELEAAILGNGDKKSGLFWKQEPALSGEALLKMLGKCTFEKSEYRAPKASFTAERHVWLTRLNNLRIVVDGKTRPLTDEERRIALPLPYETGELKYGKLRKALTKAGLSEDFRFAGLAYPSERQKAEEKTKDPEDEKLVKLPGWQELRKTLKDAGLEDEWQKISTDALDGKPQLLDEIARVLTVYKEDEEVERELGKLDLPSKAKMVDALLTVRFDKFSNLSLKALYNILPHMEAGLRYDEACEKAGYHHSQLHKVGAGNHKYLPPFYSGRDKDGRMKFDEDMDIPRNPVVLRALNQARKVVNALIREYGSPHEVHIEMARDLSRPFDERREVKKAQDEYRERNDKDKAAFASEFNIVGSVKGKEFEKYQLYREQQGKCAYSIEPIDIHRLFEAGYVEVDHALPYSRSYDDSKNNRVLVLARENRNKGNMTPYEYLDGKNNGERWRQFVGFVEGNKAYRLAKRSRLLRKDFGEKESREFRERNLNDTRYICKFFKNYVEQYLQLHEDSEAKRCVVLSGQMTSFMRARWGLVKVRADSDRHHALDAAVVAACSHGMVKRLSDYSRRKELDQVREGFVDVETGEIVNPAMFQKMQEHFPDPWPYFRDELKARLSIDDPALLRAEMERLGTYPPEALQALRPLFVSRAPQRRNSGAAHKETIYAQPERLKAQSGVTQKVAVTSLTVKDLDNLIDPHRNEKLYAAIREWLTHRDAREKRAKEIEAGAGRGKGKRELTADEKDEIAELRALPRKPDKDGNPTGPIVRTVTMVIDKLSGIPVRGGIAKNDTMLRVDVFTKANKFHLVPVYVHHSVAKVLPNRAIVQGKDEDEWTQIDDSFQFCFSMHPNDLIRVQQKGKAAILGYYSSCHRGTGNINLWAHDRNQQVGKDGMMEGIGVKTAQSIEKFHVDVLARIYPAPPETRRDLA
ncbi:MAG: type II CRISPR RNA-guided endonuclease Cas9 [Nitrosomonadales bacterium]|nr:type II CRISPR RNA-guided endonuclease Cas9 [Nitrosomonadales bacterium]